MGHRRGHGGRALSNIHTQCNNLKVKMVNPLCYLVTACWKGEGRGWRENFNYLVSSSILCMDVGGTNECHHCRTRERCEQTSV